MRCAIISIYSFPNGMAPTNRILAYSKGMLKSGVKMNIILPFPTDNYGEFGKNVKGCFENVNYVYTSGTTKNKYKIFRALSTILLIRKIKGFITSYYYIYKTNKKEHYNCIIVSTDHLLTLWFYGIATKILKIKSVFIFDEYPTPIRHKLKNKIPKWKKSAYKMILKKYNAYISISEKLEQYFNNLYPNKTHVLPVIVDVSRFNSEEKQITELTTIKYICYMGNMEISKDDVDNIIRAFALISDKDISLKFFLYGPASSITKIFLNHLISSFNLQNRVFLMGRVNSDMVPQVLKQAYILVSSQPDTVRSSGGFPTKLGEYLAAGVPALLTDVGENSKYVKAGEHIYFVEPHNPEKYAEKLLYIIDHYEEALRVAKNGQKYLLGNYSHISQGRELLKFIKSL